MRISAASDAGSVVTFDDVTDLMSAQRMAAWGDVARRIAHEIKNPLTPIQLSAERLKRRYLKQIKDDPETFSICTDTIIRQVGDIGRMVDEFSSFARMPRPTVKPEDAKELCQQALFLQRNGNPDIRYVSTLARPSGAADLRPPPGVAGPDQHPQELGRGDRGQGGRDPARRCRRARSRCRCATMTRRCASSSTTTARACPRRAASG